MYIETNSTGPMNATLRFYMNATQLEMELGHDFNLSKMTWCYWNETDWEPVRSRLTFDGFLARAEQLTWAYWNGENWAPVDSTLTDENVLEAETDHFSTWVIIQVEEYTEPETTKHWNTHANSVYRNRNSCSVIVYQKELSWG